MEYLKEYRAVRFGDDEDGQRVSFARRFSHYTSFVKHIIQQDIWGEILAAEDFETPELLEVHAEESKPEEFFRASSPIQDFDGMHNLFSTWNSFAIQTPKKEEEDQEEEQEEDEPEEEEEDTSWEDMVNNILEEGCEESFLD